MAETDGIKAQMMQKYSKRWKCETFARNGPFYPIYGDRTIEYRDIISHIDPGQLTGGKLFSHTKAEKGQFATTNSLEKLSGI